jgi:hypothetical protein
VVKRVEMMTDRLGGNRWLQAMRVKNLNEMFPVVDAEAPPTANPREFANLLWKQLGHLGCVYRSDPRFQPACHGVT